MLVGGSEHLEELFAIFHKEMSLHKPIDMFLFVEIPAAKRWNLVPLHHVLQKYIHKKKKKKNRDLVYKSLQNQ